MRALKKFMKVWSTLPCTLYNSLNKNVEAINKKKKSPNYAIFRRLRNLFKLPTYPGLRYR